MTERNRQGDGNPGGKALEAMAGGKWVWRWNFGWPCLPRWRVVALPLLVAALGGCVALDRVAGAGGGLSPGDRFRDCPECPEMVVVPSGSFRMGSPSSEQGRFGDEGPMREVTIGSPFALGVHEVTVAEFGHFVDETGHSTGDSCWLGDGEGGVRERRGWRNPGFGQGGAHPVVCVSWHDARAYVAWLSGTTGERYRLPSEAEWEYAARAGTTTPFHTGETISTDQANYDGNYLYGSGRKGVYREKTVPVGVFAPNAWGLHDMHGNVAEWVEDCWKGSYAGVPSDGSAWESGDCSLRFTRGGSWYNVPRNLRSASRGRYIIGNDSFPGFRVARTLTP